MSQNRFSLNSFFSGIGGFDIAFENQGFITQLQCEINPFCNQILSKHWPNVQKFQDINDIEENSIPDANVWCGGFPCQDISVARGSSTRLGLLGQRSGLFYRFAELIKRKQPEVVVIENVGGLFNSNNGRDFGVILQTLSSLGYGIAWRLLNSRYFGVPQSRTRVYLCCWKNSTAKAIKVLFDAEGAVKPSNTRKAFLTEDSMPNEYPKVPQIAYCLAASSGRHTGTDWSRTYVVCKSGVRRLSPLESERLQGLPDNWTKPTITDGLEVNNDTLRYTAIGNAVSVPVVEWLAKKIRLILDGTINETTLEETIEFYKDAKAAKQCKAPLKDIDFSDVNKEHKWLRGGFVANDVCFEKDIHPTPSTVIETTLLPLIEKDQKNEIYYLTPNAAEGILRRVDHQKRTLFSPLRNGLELLASKNVK